MSTFCPADVHVADGSACTDHNPCTQTDACQGGVCVGSNLLDCDDGDPCTADACAPLGGCAHLAAPANGCVTAQKSFLLLRNKMNDSNDKLIWKWSKGAALDQTDFADPTSGTTYGVCVYAGSTDTLVADAVLPPGTGWSALGTKGYRFSGTSPDGLTTAFLKGGAAGKSKALSKGAGAALPDPALPLSFPVTVQLVKDGSSLCLESMFNSATHNDASQFKAKTP